METIKVAQIMGKAVNGGVDAVVMNYYQHIDRTKVQFDFIVDADSTHIPREQIERLGGRVFVVPPYQQLNKYIPALIKLFKENHYKIVHSHINTLSVFPLYAAKKAGVPVRIAHNHSTAAKGEWKKNMLKYALRPFAKVYATRYAACSKRAGEWLFGRKAMKSGKVMIFNNAIDLQKFKFNPVVREKVRSELGINNSFVIGHVGRFVYAKNHEFLIDVFEKVHEKNPNAVLLLIGDGEKYERIEEKVRKMRGGGVILLGNRKDIECLYQAMDIFVLPSRIEGFPVAGVEAQANGLPVLFSDNVPEEARLANSCISLSLQNGIEFWAERIIAMSGMERKLPLQMQSFDISIQAEKLTQYYKKDLNEYEKRKR